MRSARAPRSRPIISSLFGFGFSRRSRSSREPTSSRSAIRLGEIFRRPERVMAAPALFSQMGPRCAKSASTTEANQGPHTRTRCSEPVSPGVRCAYAKRWRAASRVRRRRVWPSALAPPPPVISLFHRIMSLFRPINSLFGAIKFAVISTIVACHILYNRLKRLIIHPKELGRKRCLPSPNSEYQARNDPQAVRAMRQAASCSNQPGLCEVTVAISLLFPAQTMVAVFLG